MNRNLKNIAMQLTESDIKEIIRIKKTGDKRLEALRNKRAGLVEKLAALDSEIAALIGDATVEKAPRRRGPARGTKRGKVNFVAKMREVFEQAGEPLRAREIVDALPGVGVKMKDIPYTRKRVSVALATNKCFEQVERGVYRLREE